MLSPHEIVDVLLQAFAAGVVEPTGTRLSPAEGLDAGGAGAAALRPTDTHLSLTESLDIVEDEGAISFAIRICRYEDGQLSDIHESSCSFPMCEVSLERWAAYWSGLMDAVPALVANADAKLGWEINPGDLFRIHSRLLLDESCRTREQFAERSADPALFDALDELYEEFLKEARPEPRDEVQRRRARAHEEAMARFPEVAAQVRRTHGLELPKHIALGWALIHSFSPAEREAFDAVFVTTLADLQGVFPLFEEGAAARAASPGEDARLHLRTSHTPPEMLPLFLGALPGIFSQYGLFYDDPAFLPCGIASISCDAHQIRWHRDYELSWEGETFFDVLYEHVDFDLDYLEESDDRDRGVSEAERRRREQIRRRLNHQRRLISEALDDFAAPEALIRDEDRTRMRWSFAERRQMAPIASGMVGIATDQGDAEDLPYLQELDSLHDLWTSERERLHMWIDEAEDALEGGDPRYALALGRDIYAAGERGDTHTEGQWFDRGAAEGVAVSLLKPAYEALGRGALARLVELPRPALVDLDADGEQR